MGDINLSSSCDSAYAAALHIHKNILSDGQNIFSNVLYSENSFVMIGRKFYSARGRYLAMVRTSSDVISMRIIDDNTLGYSAITPGSENQYTDT